MISKTSMLGIKPPSYIVLCEVPLVDDSRGNFYRFRIGSAETPQAARELIAADRRAMGTDRTGGLVGAMSQKEIAKRKYVIWKAFGWERILE